MDARYVIVFVKVQVDEVFAFVRDVVFFHCLVHVKWSAEAFPGVRSCMLIQLQISVKDLIHSLLARTLDHVVSLG